MDSSSFGGYHLPAKFQPRQTRTHGWGSPSCTLTCYRVKSRTKIDLTEIAMQTSGILVHLLSSFCPSISQPAEVRLLLSFAPMHSLSSNRIIPSNDTTIGNSSSICLAWLNCHSSISKWYLKQVLREDFV